MKSDKVTQPPLNRVERYYDPGTYEPDDYDRMLEDLRQREPDKRRESDKR